MITVFSIGYEDHTPETFVEALRSHGVKQLVDVRVCTQTRTRGFSKTRLCALLSSHGIRYQHLCEAGARCRFRELSAESLGLYGEYVDRHGSIVHALAETVEYEPSAVMGFAADHARCQRSVLLDRLCTRFPRVAVRKI